MENDIEVALLEYFHISISLQLIVTFKRALSRNLKTLQFCLLSFNWISSLWILWFT